MCEFFTHPKTCSQLRELGIRERVVATRDSERWWGSGKGDWVGTNGEGKGGHVMKNGGDN